MRENPPWDEYVEKRGLSDVLRAPTLISLKRTLQQSATIH